MFKDKAVGKQITHFVGLRPKLYSYKIDVKGIRKCKGIKKNIIEKEITFEDLVNCLHNETVEMRSMNIIRSENHELNSKKVDKIALSGNDNKRTILKNKINTLAIR